MTDRSLIPVQTRWCELLIGGQKSGKSRRAESMAAQWLAGAPERRALLLATAESGDEEMQRRIARHQQDRAERVPGLATQETGLDLALALRQYSRPDTLLIVDCLTLWLTRCLMPLQPAAHPLPDMALILPQLTATLGSCPGPVILVSNEIGLGVIPLGRETRAFVDMLGSLNQQAAAACDKVTLMAAGLPLALKNTLKAPE